MVAGYADYLERKSQLGIMNGFDPVFYPEAAFDFQKYLLDWIVRKGRGAVFADCGLGKSLLELAFAENVVRKTNGNVLLLTPIAVGAQIGSEVWQAVKMGRRGLGFELKSSYFDQAKRNMAELMKEKNQMELF